MQILYLGILKNEDKPAVELSVELELKSFNRFTRSSVSEFLTVFAKTLAERTKPGQRQSVAPEKDSPYIIHAYGRIEGICGILISNKDYPNPVAHKILGQICDEFTTMYPRTAYADQTALTIKNNGAMPFSALKDHIEKYQDPQQADKFAKIQKEIDDTTIVLHKTIESVLQRGEKIDDLVAKSDGLSAQSKMFYTQAKKQNSCCTVM